MLKTLKFIIQKKKFPNRPSEENSSITSGKMMFMKEASGKERLLENIKKEH